MVRISQESLYRRRTIANPATAVPGNPDRSTFNREHRIIVHGANTALSKRARRKMARDLARNRFHFNGVACTRSLNIPVS